MLQSLEPRGRGWWRLAQSLHVVLGSGHNAANQGHKQQEIDGGEPHRGERIKELEAIEDGEEFRIIALELNNAIRVTGALGHQRTRD